MAKVTAGVGSVIDKNIVYAFFIFKVKNCQKKNKKNCHKTKIYFFPRSDFALSFFEP